MRCSQVLSAASPRNVSTASSAQQGLAGQFLRVGRADQASEAGYQPGAMLGKGCEQLRAVHHTAFRRQWAHDGHSPVNWACPAMAAGTVSRGTSV